MKREIVYAALRQLETDDRVIIHNIAQSLMYHLRTRCRTVMVSEAMMLELLAAVGMLIVKKEKSHENLSTPNR